jgi:hypothetical protein
MLDLLATVDWEEADVEKRYETFIGMIHSSAEAAKTGTQRRHRDPSSGELVGCKMQPLE